MCHFNKHTRETLKKSQAMINTKLRTVTGCGVADKERGDGIDGSSHMHLNQTMYLHTFGVTKGLNWEDKALCSVTG